MMGFIRRAVLVLLGAVLFQVLFNEYRVQKARPPVRVDGFVAPGYEGLRAVFEQLFEGGVEEGGAAYSAYHRGQLVADLWGGWADPVHGVPWRNDTMSVFYSTTKGVAALTVAMLVDRGLLSYDHLVTKYWPEYGTHGKGQTTVRMLVAHQAGLPYLERELRTAEDWRDLKTIHSVLAGQRPQWPPGTRHGYHAMTHGWLLDGLVQRVDSQRRSVGQFFREEVAAPCGIDFTLGTPLSENHRIARHRMARLRWWDVVGFLKSVYRLNTELLEDNPLLNEVMTREIGALRMDRPLFNDPQYLLAEQAATNGVGTARAQAKLYNLLVTGGKCRGKRLISQKTLDIISKQVTSGKDAVFGSMIQTQFSGAGFFILPKPFSPAFGSPGYGVQDGFGDTTHQLAWSFLTNTISNDHMEDPRAIGMRKTLYDVAKSK